MDLKPLYLLRFRYPDGWEVTLDGEMGRTEQHFYLAEGSCEGAINGSFRAANYPRRCTDATFVMDLNGVIETGDGATIMLEYRGYGRAYPKGRRQVVGAAWHLTGDERYKRLNDGICVIAGEVRAPGPQRPIGELVFEISELIWAPPPD